MEYGNLNMLESKYGPNKEVERLLEQKWNHLTESILDKNDEFCGYPSHMGRKDKHLLEHKQKVTNFLLEQTAAWLDGRYTLSEASLAADAGPFTTWALPLIRRVFPRLMMFDLCTTLPMAQPTGKAFWLDIKRDPAATRVDAAASFNKAYADDPGEGQAPAKLKFAISEADISATGSKLTSEWGIEAEQNLRAYHGLDAMPELMAAMGDEIVREIDYKGLHLMLDGAGAGDVEFTKDPPDGLDQINLRMYERTLYAKIAEAQNLIFKKRYRKGNWIISGVDEIFRLEKCEDFRITPGANDGSMEIGRHLLGELNNRCSVYVDPWWEDTDKILVGYKGMSWLETGFIYSPFIPLYVTPLFTDPNTFQPRRGMMSRYAMKMLQSEFFATVSLV
jgi:hypothetical protein